MLLSTPEIQRLSMAVGALTAIAWKDRRGVIPGGIVVPGFLVNALVLSAPWCLAILLLSVTIQAIYRRWLERVDHQRRQPMYILGVLSLLLSTPIAWLLIQAGLLPSSLDSITGTFLPGVIAFNLHRQGLKRVMGGVVAVTAITALITGLLVWTGTALLQLDFDQLNRYYLHADNLRLRAQWPQFLVAMLVGSLLYRRTGMRPGGYMVAPIAAALLLEPLSDPTHPYPVEIDLPPWTVKRDVDFRRWLFGYGAEVVIERPAPLRQEHQRRAEAVAGAPPVRPNPLSQDGLLNLFSAEATGKDFVLEPATDTDMRGKHAQARKSLEVVYDNA
jgi:hypothetical protein